MIRKDQTSALVQRMTELLPLLDELKKQQRHKEAIDEINETVRSNIGLSPRFVKGVSDQDLLGMYRSGLITTERAVALAKLLKERADLNWAMAEPNNGLIRTVKALTLYLEVFDKDQEKVFADYYADVEMLAGNVGDHQLAGETRRKLFRFFEATGRYSRAEDVLFEALEAAGDRESSGRGEWVDEGRQFYARLAAKSDAELEAGNLPRAELADSQADLSRFESSRQGRA